MAYGAHTILFQIVMQTVTILFALHNDWEEVVCVLLVRQKVRKGDQRIVDVVIIVVSYNLTLCIILNKVLQLHVKNGSLNLIKTAIATCLLEDVLALATIVGKGTNSCCKLWVVSSYSSTITKGTKVLARVE